MSQQQGIKITIKGPGINVERDVADGVAREVLLLVLGGRAAEQRDGADDQSSLQRAPLRGEQPLHGRMKLREFLNAHNPKRHPEKIATIAEYLKTYESKATVTKQSLAKAYEDASEPVPGNLSRDITWSVKIGWLAAKQGERDTYFITSSGSQAVRTKFPPELRKKTKVSRGGRRRTTEDK
jgi:hypothetical protein